MAHSIPSASIPFPTNMFPLPHVRASKFTFTSKMELKTGTKIYLVFLHSFYTFIFKNPRIGHF